MKKIIIFFFIISAAFTSCKSYELMHYQGAEIEKPVDASKYRVYLHAKKNIFKVTKPTLSKTGFSGNLELIKDQKEAEEIRNSGSAKLARKYRHNLNVFTKTAIADSAKKVLLPKREINEYTLVVSKSKINWHKVGDIVTLVFGLAVCCLLIGALIYWFTFT